MITVTVNGTYEGHEASKSTDGEYYVYIAPVAPTFALLKNINIKPPFGKPRNAPEKLGTFGIICPADKLPSLAFGAKITCTAHLWPIVNPTWSARTASITHSRRPSPRYILSGDFKSTNAKLAPCTFRAEGFFAGAVRNQETRLVDVKLTLDDAPGGILRARAVKTTGQEFADAEEQLGNLVMHAEPQNLSPIVTGGACVAEGTLWPVSCPYWDEHSGSVAWPVVASAHCILSALREAREAKPEKVSA